MISVNRLCKTYKVRQQTSSKNILKSLFKSEYRYVKAVQDISFEIEQGEMAGREHIRWYGRSCRTYGRAGIEDLGRRKKKKYGI